MSGRARRLLPAALVLAVACSTDEHVLVWVDTDLPVPRLADRLRIDVFTERARTWIASRDMGIGESAEDGGVLGPALPVSFAIDAESGGQVLVRVRLYRDGDLREYVPENRLRVAGTAPTPRSEPEPRLCIDRLAQVELDPGRAGMVKLLLHGDCLGVPANLKTLETCVDGRTKRKALEPEPLLDLSAMESSSSSSTWWGARAKGCDEVSERGDTVCMPATVFILGDEAIVAFGAAAATPRRYAVVSPFLIDRHEYTVGRYLEALDAGFEPSAGGAPSRQQTNLVGCEGWKPENDAVFPLDADMPLACVDWHTAQALCERDGGKLPTEVQWERAAVATASVEGRPYPWPDREAVPDCERALFGRANDVKGDTSCFDLGVGPSAVNASPWAERDVTPEGVVGLGGNVAEWTRDSHRAYDHACWEPQPLRDPTCFEREPAAMTVRGGSWSQSPDDMRAASRSGAAPDENQDKLGFRCVYPLSTTRLE